MQKLLKRRPRILACHTDSRALRPLITSHADLKTMLLLQTADLDGVSTNAENGHENVDIETIRHRADYSVELDEAFKALLDTIGVTKLEF